MISIGLALAYVQTLGSRTPGEQMFVLYMIYVLDSEPESLIQGSAELMAKVLKCSPRSFERYIKNLGELGIITKQRCKTKNGLKDPNKYGLPGWVKFLEKYEKSVATIST